jgi:hypothetical protein
VRSTADDPGKKVGSTGSGRVDSLRERTVYAPTLYRQSLEVDLSWFSENVTDGVGVQYSTAGVTGVTGAGGDGAARRAARAASSF